jgi:hypothetical protein
VDLLSQSRAQILSFQANLNGIVNEPLRSPFGIVELMESVAAQHWVDALGRNISLRRS